MNLIVDTSRVEFTVTRGWTEKLDQNGRQKTDRVSGQGLYSAQVMALDEKGGEIITVTVAGVQPELTVGARVVPVELEAIPWATGGRNGVAFRAAAIRPVSAGSVSSVSKPAA